jgi:ribosomal protein S18 acetylase RimI-like enzyme
LTDLSEQPLRWDAAVSLAPSLPHGWLEDYAQLSGIPERYVAVERQMLQSIVPARAFATLRENDQTLALGLAVAERGYVGLFSIVTASQVRNRGLGRRLVSHLLAWGQQRGAQAGYLAVALDNTPAWRLYARFGFREAYRYWYRTRPWQEPAIRPAVAAESQLVRTCVQAAYGPWVARIGREPAPTNADYPELIRRGVVYILPEIGGEAVGGVLVSWPRENGLFVENVAVHPRAQGQGAGRRLLAYAEDQARALGLAAIWLYTNEAMTENLELYRRLGYVETGRRVEDGFRRVFLRKNLVIAPHTRD